MANQAAGGADPSGGHPYTDFRPSGIEPRISATGFTVGIFTVLGVSILTILCRLALRLQRSHSLAPDDYFLIIALITLIGACATQQAYRDITYYIVNISSGNALPTADLPSTSLSKIAVLDATSVLLWTSIFCVKLSFLSFFRPLVSRVRNLQIFWWVVSGFVLVSALICIPLGFIECAYFGPDILVHCPVDSLIQKERIYLDVTIVLDILTDVLIIALPIALLWNVKIDLKKKLTLIGMFGLNVVMIIIALIRVAMADLPGDVIDTTWLFFWQIMEASIALVMVSVSAFKGLFGQSGSHNGDKKANSFSRKKQQQRAGARNAIGDAEKGLQDNSAQRGRPADFELVVNDHTAMKHFERVHAESIEMSRVASTPPSTAGAERRMTTSKDLPNIPGTPTMGYQSAESPMTARCWSDSPSLSEKRNSLSRPGSIKEMVKQHVRGRSRTPSLGEALIEENEGRVVRPRGYV